MKYSPDWVLNLACSVITKRYVLENVPIESFTNIFSKALEPMYEDLTGSKLREGVEKEMRFLATLDVDDYIEIVNAHIFYTVTYEKPGKKRNINGFFSSALKPKATETSIATNSKSFKAFVFQLRSEPKLKPESSWDLSHVKDMDSLIAIFNSPALVFDAL